MLLVLLSMPLKS